MPIRKRASVLAKIRYLRAMGPLPRRKRIPRQLQPDAIRVEYAKSLFGFTQRWRRLVTADQDYIVRLLQADRMEKGKFDHRVRMDASFRGTQAKKIIKELGEKAADQFDPRELKETAEKFAKRTSQFSKEQLGKQVQAVLSVPLSVIETPVTEQIDRFVAWNLDLVKSVQRRYFDRLADDVEEAFEKGIHPYDLIERFAEDYDITESEAERIARDQIGKLNAQVNQARQEAMGLEGYIWRTMNDQRVRDEHSDREGQSFTWDNPPEDGAPGEPIQCRCFAEPDFSSLLEEL